MTTPIPIPQDVAEAAEQRRSLAYNSKNGTWTDSVGLVLEADDVRDLDRTLADFALTLITTQQQQAAERELPVTLEWLMTLLNLKVVPGVGYMLSEKVFVINSRRGWLIQVYNRMTAEPEDPIVIVPAPITHGQVLDLCRVLGVTLKGGE